MLLKEVKLRKRLNLQNQQLLQKVKLLSRKRLRRKLKNNRQRWKLLKREPVQESNQEETEASGKTSDLEPVEASAGTVQTDVSSEPEPDPSENKESKEEK
jgi:hypothetical protein